MRHSNNKRKFGRDKNQRKALLNSLALNLIVRGKIKTTEPKAKELRRFIESFQIAVVKLRNFLKLLLLNIWIKRVVILEF